jgi:Putative death-receptor fusion protein (DUF2428)
MQSCMLNIRCTIALCTLTQQTTVAPGSGAEAEHVVAGSWLIVKEAARCLGELVACAPLPTTSAAAATAGTATATGDSSHASSDADGGLLTYSQVELHLLEVSHCFCSVSYQQAVPVFARCCSSQLLCNTAALQHSRLLSCANTATTHTQS